jgi:hypothetical protein
MPLTRGDLLIQIGYTYPIYAVWIVGIVFAVRYWSRAPKVGLVVIATLSILIVSSAGWPLFHTLVRKLSEESRPELFTPGDPPPTLDIVLFTLAYIPRLNFCVHAVAWAAILWVLFGLVRQLSEKQQAAAAGPGPPERS